MQLSNEFRVAIPVEQAWAVLTDVERIALCMPGAELREVEGEEYRGVVAVRVGPVSAEYQGTARFLERDDIAHRAVLRAEGHETAGQGDANATVTADLTADGDATRVSVVTDLAVSGEASQFGTGELADVSEKLIGRFVACLEATILGAEMTRPPSDLARPANPAPAEAGPTEAGPTEAGPAEAGPTEAAAVGPDSDERGRAEPTTAELPKPKRARKATVTPGAGAAEEAAASEPEPGAPVEHNGVSQAGNPISSNGSSNGSAAGSPRRLPPTHVEPVDLSDVARAPMAKRVIGALVAALAVALGGALILRRWRS